MADRRDYDAVGLPDLYPNQDFYSFLRRCSLARPIIDNYRVVRFENISVLLHPTRVIISHLEISLNSCYPVYAFSP